MKRIENPPNPYLSAHREWLEPPPAVALEVYQDDSRNILSHNDSPDIPFRWSVNPYRGCQHACAYCYARPTHEYLGFGAGTDFDTRLTVKPDAAALLARAFSRKTWQRESVAFGGVTDCYQPLEAVWRVTRACLEVCRDFANPLAIVTKSYLVVRDIDLLTQISRRASASVHISIPFADAALARQIEPHAPSPQRRFEALRLLRQAGVDASVFVAPIIPGLNDRDIPAILEQAAECGANGASYVALRLPGSTQPVFLERLRRELPLQAARIEKRIRDIRGGRLDDARFGCRMTGTGPYWDAIRQLFDSTARRLGLDDDSLARRCAEHAQATPGSDCGSHTQETSAASRAGPPAPAGAAREPAAAARRSAATGQLELF
ncbi:MAG: hypothetical protein CHACPFDD_00095 [Phycisphaerae bacterium]|nr:hypothetical protein [Phycisphaerae bacterium]